MISVKVPFRLPLGGGSTDLPSYYSQFGCQLITASINKYMLVHINEPETATKIKLYYAFTEVVNDVSEIKHDIIRESLKLKGINRPIEIGSMADIEAGTGMGSSSAFTVGLLAGLNAMERKFLSPLQLAEEACRVEIDMVGKPIGKQDQYATALGGINEMIIDKSGNVTINPIKLSSDTLFDLESRLLMFYTNVSRDANIILGEQSSKAKDNPFVIEAMHEIKEIGVEIKESLLKGDIDTFGDLLNAHWQNKKCISKNMSSSQIDRYYKLALRKGALGGKIMGAGGGGLLLFCCREGERKKLKNALINAGLRYMDFRFEFEGCKVITNM